MHGMYEAQDLVKNRHMTIISAIIGYVFGLVLLGMGIFVSGGGHGTSVFLDVFSAPAGLDVIQVPIWWAFLFGAAASNLKKQLRLFIIAIGECVHFLVATTWIMNTPQIEWDSFYRMSKRPFATPLFLIFICTYLLVHIAVFFLCFRKREIRKREKGFRNLMKQKVPIFGIKNPMSPKRRV